MTPSASGFDPDATPFNKPAPPGFRGLDPDLPIRMYRRNLPHWRQDGAVYAVTFRLEDSIPQDKLRSLQRWRDIWEQQHPESERSDADWRQLAQEITSKTERWMDKGYGSCVFGQPRFSKLMSSSLLHFQDERHVTYCFVVMPNHIHTVIRPIHGYELEECLQRIKQFVSMRVNIALGQTGSLWEEESYDRIIRDEEHLWNVVQYIGRNPNKAGISQDRWVRWIHPDWESVGWGYLE